MKRDIQWSGDRGEGSIFFRKNPDVSKKSSPYLYGSYRAAGREHVVSLKTMSLEKAKERFKRLLRNRENAKEGREPLVTPKTERVTVGELLDANVERAKEQGLATARGIGYRSARLKQSLGKIRAVSFRAEHVDAYKNERRAEKISDTSIRHELCILDGAFRYAVKRRVLAFAPYVEKPSEDNVRKKALPVEAYPKLLSAIECDDVRDLTEWLLLTAMRPKGARTMLWDWFDKKTWTLRLPSEKGGNAREFSIEGTLRSVIERRLAARRPGCPFIFHHRGRELKQDRTLRVFYAALKKCELPIGRKGGFVLYDTKKTAASLLIDSGLTEREAMDFSGHRTASMFDRYVIKSAERHGRSVRQRDAYLAKRLADTSAENADTVVQISGFLSENEVLK